ncbi:MAG TPA: HWE histidine kinase domain-containing protein, partial [Devosia sp.]
LAEERAKADVRQRMLNEELNHRVKNILAVIKSLVGQPVREGRSLSDYVASLKGRIQALAVAHDQVIRGEGGGQIAELIEAEISPYRTANVAIALQGPGVWLDARAFSVMALVLHELATNAAKYGALSRAGGRLDVNWHIDGRGCCIVDWREGGGPLVTPPSREGFGTYLLDRSVPFDLGGTSDVEFVPEGVRARFCLPSKHVRRSTEAVVTATARVVTKRVAVLPAETRILLLEDQMLIAMDIEASLADRGYSAVTTTNSVREALVVLERQRPDVAILDINLGETTSLPVAEALVRLGIPFIFATGYGEGTSIPEGFADVPIVRKPYDIAAVVAALASVVGASSS